MKTFFIYLRTSTKNQSNGIETQTHAILQHLENLGHTDENSRFVYYEDEGVSGAKENRKGLGEMMDAIETLRHPGTGAMPTVVTYSFSRIARSLKHLISFTDHFRRIGVNMVSVKENINTTTKEGRLMLNIMGAIGEFERELIADRVKDGLANAKANGVKIGPKKKYEHKAILALHHKNHTYDQIAAQIGCSKSLIAKVIKKSKNRPIPEPKF